MNKILLLIFINIFIAKKVYSQRKCNILDNFESNTGKLQTNSGFIPEAVCNHVDGTIEMPIYDWLGRLYYTKPKSWISRDICITSKTPRGGYNIIESTRNRYGGLSSNLDALSEATMEIIWHDIDLSCDDICSFIIIVNPDKGFSGTITIIDDDDYECSADVSVEGWKENIMVTYSFDFDGNCNFSNIRDIKYGHESTNGLDITYRGIYLCN